jgi:omega-6 fatty acid desaturase (delta-12 desaturase)
MEKNDTSWMKIIMKYNHPDNKRSWFQLISNCLMYFGGLALMVWSLQWSYWFTLLLALPVAGILVRIFIIFHDCGHGSFFKSKNLETFIGYFTGILTFTPFKPWSDNHLIHHKTAGNLDKRGTGDVWTLTVKEYLESSVWKRLGYRLYRHPLVMFGLGSLFVFIIFQRLTYREMDTTQRMGVYITNGGILVNALLLSLMVGFKAFLLIQLPVIYFAGIMGIWLFYVQHQFDPSYWSHTDTWDYHRVAMEGSSFYKLPGIFRWFSGSIGYHHIHHLSPKIPNYNLKKCHDENDFFSGIKPLTFWQSVISMKYRLWDEDNMKMVTIKEIRSA